MKAQLNLLAASLILAASSITQASFTLYQPLEESRGGALPNGSIGFKDHSGSGDNGSGNEGGQEEPVVKTPTDLCNEKAEIAKTYISQNYSDVIYKSHMYGQYMTGSPPSFVNGCQIYYTINNGSACFENVEYSKPINASLKSLGFEVAAMACS